MLVLIKQCTHVQLRHVVESNNSYGIVGINILDDSHFFYIKNIAIMIAYNDTTVDKEIHNLLVDHYHYNGINNDVNKCKITLILISSKNLTE